MQINEKNKPKKFQTNIIKSLPLFVHVIKLIKPQEEKNKDIRKSNLASKKSLFLKTTNNPKNKETKIEVKCE
jgi:hypothetical protein